MQNSLLQRTVARFTQRRSNFWLMAQMAQELLRLWSAHIQMQHVKVTSDLQFADGFRSQNLIERGFAKLISRQSLVCVVVRFGAKRIVIFRGVESAAVCDDGGNTVSNRTDSTAAIAILILQVVGLMGVTVSRGVVDRDRDRFGDFLRNNFCAIEVFVGQKLGVKKAVQR